MAETTCIFCERSATDVKMTREHLWPNWINKLPANSRFAGPVERTRVLEDDESQREVDSWTTRILADQTIRCVCEACNGGWMSQIEAAAKPHILAMMHGAPYTLGPDAQSILATWTTLKAMIMEYVQPADRRRGFVFTQRQRTELVRSGSPLADVAVVIAAVRLPDSRLNAFLAASNLGPLLSATRAMGASPGTPFPIDATVRIGAFFTIAIGNVALRAFAGEIASDWLRAHPPTPDDRMSVIFPTGGPMQWPPKEVMDPDTFASFTRPVGQAGPPETNAPH
jgi:hypothetical protein